LRVSNLSHTARTQNAAQATAIYFSFLVSRPPRRLVPNASRGLGLPSHQPASTPNVICCSVYALPPPPRPTPRPPGIRARCAHMGSPHRLTGHSHLQRRLQHQQVHRMRDPYLNFACFQQDEAHGQPGNGSRQAGARRGFRLLLLASLNKTTTRNQGPPRGATVAVSVSFPHSLTLTHL
jgi:hypothetical protein